MNNQNRSFDANHDPLTRAHPVGTVGGERAGKGVTEEFNPTRERACWSENISGHDYVEIGSNFDDYGPDYDFHYVERSDRQSRSIQPKAGAGQARGARCRESNQPDDLTGHMEHLATGSDQHPSLALLGAEALRAAMEFAWHQFGMSDDAKPGDGHPVVIFPGLGADGNSVATLRAHCRALGYDAFDWGQGFNTGPHGDLDVWLHTLKSQVIDLLADHTQPATLIGWSLGGLYARELAKLMAPRIRQVITMGTPFNVRADNTNVGWLLRTLNGTSSAMGPALSLRLRTPPPMRTTSIYSRSDGVVAWQTCRHEKRSNLVHDIEVDSSHIGMGWNRDVLAAVADRLGQPPGPCYPYVRAQ